MKLDLDLIRNIMLSAQSAPPATKVYKSELLKLCSDENKLAEHVQHLIEVGYLDAVVHVHNGQIPSNIIIRKIKAPGHEFLHLMELDTTWNKIKSFSARSLTTVSLAMLVEYAKEVVQGRITP